MHNEHRPNEKNVEAMFNDIAPRYDFLNHVLSAGIDKVWRKRIVKRAIKVNPKSVIDVATGTADLAIQLAKKDIDVRVTGVDIAQKMLDYAQEKVNHRNLDKRISLVKASSEQLPFPDNSFDAATVAFGVRNFESPVNGLAQMLRVIKPGAYIFVLEFATPKKVFVAKLYNVYFNRVLPWIGRKISGHDSAYTYLPNSVGAFKEREEFLQLLKDAGFINTNFKLQSFGIAAIYWAQKPIT